MQGDNDDGSFSAAELERLEAAGIIEVHRPGTSGWHEHARQMADEIAVDDAERLALDGPDTLTSARLLRQTALVAELDPEKLGHAFAAWCASRGWERSDLASWLGVTTDQLAAMALIARLDGHLATRYGADADRLAAVLGG